MTYAREELKAMGISEYELDRARWHMRHGTKEFRDFLAKGDHFELAFALWLKDRHVPLHVAHP